MRAFESIINVMNFNGGGSSTLSQHCSARRMDDNYGWTSNKLSYAITDIKNDIKRLDKEFAA